MEGRLHRFPRGFASFTDEPGAQKEKATPQGHPDGTALELKPEAKTAGTGTMSFGAIRNPGSVGTCMCVGVCASSAPECCPGHC